MNIVSQRLLKVISDKKTSYRELSESTGISKSAIQRYAVGDTDKIPIDVVESLAKALHISAAYLMGWTDNPEGIKISPDKFELAEGEKELIELFRQVSPERRELVLQMVRVALSQQ